MYFALEAALKRILGTPELMIKTVSWQQDINTGYRRNLTSGEARSKDERIGDDGVCQRKLRERMTPEFHAILTVRYDDNPGNRASAWQQVQHHFRSDARVPEVMRSNPVLLRLWLMYELQHPELRVGKGKVEFRGKSERTVYRWKKACRQVCNEWVRLAEDQAQDVLEQEGAIRHEP